MSDELRDLLSRASVADPEIRIDFRDPIAAFGADAIVEIQPWLTDERLGFFAARVVGKSAQQGAVREAAEAFRSALAKAPSARLRADLQAELARLSPREPTRPPRGRASPPGRRGGA